MKSISKADAVRLEAFKGQLQLRFHVLDLVSEKMKQAAEVYNREIAAFNELVAEMHGFGEDIAREIEEYMDLRSETWHENRGEAYELWRDQWQSMEGLTDLDTVDIPEPPLLEAYIAAVDSLPYKPSEE